MLTVMKLISINVGQPRTVRWQDKLVTTGIFKEPVSGPVTVRWLNLEGDRQADLSVHGGEDKAVYGYPAEHYDHWRQELPDMALPWGMFGENLTVEGMLEAEINIGDRFRIGTVELMVTQPRLPCYKLGLKFGRVDMIKRFLASRRTGFYFKVMQEGEIEAGDTIELLHRAEHNITVADITRLFAFDKNDLATVKRAAQVAALPESWRDYFQRQLVAT
jgi:MOSC domain-containing protein YiiM